MVEIEEIQPSDPADIAEIVSHDLQTAKIGLLSGFSPLTPLAASPAETFARILRFRWLGLTAQNAARAAGASAEQLRQWTTANPAFGEALEAALSLSIADAAAKLRSLMLRDDSTGLAAVRFFLESRAEEFKKHAKLDIDVRSRGSMIEDIRRDIYGIDDAAAAAEADLSAAELPEAGVSGSREADRLGQEPASGWLDDLHP